MIQIRLFLRRVSRSWGRMRPRWRLLIGALFIALIGMGGLTPKYIFGAEIVWPYMGLIAAIGWGRSGLALGPMVFLLLFGFADDVSQAPWGSHGFANLLTYGLSALVFQTFDVERNPVLNLSLPLACLLVGVVLIWLMASVSLGQPARAAPLISAYFATVLVQIATAPLFDLGVRRALQGGRRV